MAARVLPREWWLALLLGGAVVVWVGSLFVLPERDDDAAAVPVVELPRYTIRGGHWLRTDEAGEPVYRVSADSILIYRDESMRILRPSVDGLGRHDAWTLRAPAGEVPRGGNELHLIDGVDIAGRWEDGRPLLAHTPRLVVDPRQRTLHTDEGVSIDGDGRSVRSGGMRADWEGENVELTGNVRMQLDALPN